MTMPVRNLLNKILILNKQRVQKRLYSQYFKVPGARKLFYEEYGEPIKVIKTENEDIEFDANSNQVLLRMLAAPVNPADINTIQGKYAVKPQLPSVPGNEGVAEVIAVGNQVEDLNSGDRVIPLMNALGTWRTHLVVKAEDLYKVPNEIGLADAATLTVNPCTAYRMLQDFAELDESDVIIQNGANSAVGQYVIQLCAAWDITSVNIIRDRPNVDHLKKYLKDLGANYVLTEKELRTTKLFKNRELDKPQLALNCVGGEIATEMMRHLDKGGYFVTYGGMSRQPVIIPTAALIFKDIHVRGFWMTEWSKAHANSVDRTEMFEELIDMIRKGDIKPANYDMVPFDNYQKALTNALSRDGMIGKKFILDFQEASK